ncbi:MAG: hypothetical protein AAFY38_10200 [Pseudomonadota bacterium]
MALYTQSLEEIYVASSEISLTDVYHRFGLADASIFSIAPRLIQDRVTVFTQDFALYGKLNSIGVDAVNIRHWNTAARGAGL